MVITNIRPLFHLIVLCSPEEWTPISDTPDLLSSVILVSLITPEHDMCSLLVMK